MFIFEFFGCLSIVNFSSVICTLRTFSLYILRVQNTEEYGSTRSRVQSPEYS